LYIVKTLVDSLGGRVSVEDRSPTGACFTVEFAADSCAGH
ncbi:MAG: ATP-binding protein, partial [Deltaproteobacteria bacterium]|nr:ATP-binding protein [Deltaproteobacteria bacterium]